MIKDTTLTNVVNSVESGSDKQKVISRSSSPSPHSLDVALMWKVAEGGAAERRRLQRLMQRLMVQPHSPPLSRRLQRLLQRLMVQPHNPPLIAATFMRRWRAVRTAGYGHSEKHLVIRVQSQQLLHQRL